MGNNQPQYVPQQAQPQVETKTVYKTVQMPGGALNFFAYQTRGQALGTVPVALTYDKVQVNDGYQVDNMSNITVPAAGCLSIDFNITFKSQSNTATDVTYYATLNGNPIGGSAGLTTTA